MVAARMRFTILGCGSSPGVPRPNGDFGVCDPEEPKNYRTRAAFLVERITANATTTIVIDTGPDFRTQMLKAKVRHIDGVVYTHGHADHIHGIDDLRSFALAQQDLVHIYADKPTLKQLNQCFGYCFKTPPGSNYPPILAAHHINLEEKLIISGQAGSVSLEPLLQIHGDIHSLGFRIGNVAYCTDVSQFPLTTLQQLEGLDLLILDALQYKPHPSHFSYGEAVDVIEQLRPKHALLTHMHISLDYQTVLQNTPDHIEPAYDGWAFECPAEVSP